jgi:hypothetical protein
VLQAAEASAAQQEQRLSALEGVELPLLGALQDRVDACTQQQVCQALQPQRVFRAGLL